MLQPLPDRGPGGRQVRAPERSLFHEGKGRGEGRAEDLHMGLDSLQPGSSVCSYRAQWIAFVELGGQK